MLLPTRWLAVPALILVGWALPAAAQEPPRDRPKDGQPGLPFPLPDVEKLLPPGVNPAQARLIRQQMEMTRKILEDLNKQLPGGIGPGLPLGRSADNRLGAGLEPPGDALADQLDLPRGQGLVLESVKAGSAAARAGLRNHDVLLEVGGKPVPRRVSAFTRMLSDFKTGDKLDAVVLRKGKRETIKGLTLPDPPRANRLPLRVPGAAFPNLPVPVPNLPAPLPNLRGVQAWDVAEPDRPAAGPLVLRAGKPQRVPTCYSGSVRIRALPGLSRPAGAGEAVVVLDVTPEPRLEEARAVGTPVVHKALDDQGQSLTAVPDPGPRADLNNPLARNGLAGLTSFGGGQRQAAIRLKRGDKQAKSLKELSGSLSLEVLMPSGPLVAVDNVLKAVGRTVRGEAGHTMTVQSLTKPAGGDYEVKVKLEAPSDADARLVALAGLRGGRVLRVQRVLARVNGKNVVVERVSGASPEELPVLLDAQGKPFTLVNPPARTGDVNFNGATQTRQMTLLFRPGAGQGEPARLVLNGRRRETIQVPFTLRDVPLP